MEGGESGGGLMEGRECSGWGMLPCMHGEAGTSSVVIPRWHPIVIARQLLIACCLLFMCRLPITCPLLLTCPLLFACHLPVVCHLVCHLSLHIACLYVLLLFGIVNWWCWVFGASHGARPPWRFVASSVVTSLCHGQVVRHHHHWVATHHSPAPMPALGSFAI